MIETLLLWLAERDHPPSGTTLRLDPEAGDLRTDAQRTLWVETLLLAAWRRRAAR